METMIQITINSSDLDEPILEDVILPQSEDLFKAMESLAKF
jgi:hypothetical protein